MSDIFLSYKSEDRAKAKIIAEALESHGYSVWWDRIIPPGRRFDDVIDEELSAANCVVVLWSEESVKSEWVRTEASEGIKRKILIPVLIEDVTPPLAFRQIKAAKIIDWDGTIPNPEFDLLLGSVSGMLREVPAQETEIQKTGDQGEKERKKTEINKQEEERAEKEKQERSQKEEKNRLKKAAKEKQKEQRRVAIKDAIQENMIIAVVLIISILLVGYWVFSITDRPNGTKGSEETPTPIITSTPTPPTPSPTPIPKYSTNSIDMEFVLIQAGEFDMGTASSEVGRSNDEGPVHHVTIPEPFYMSIYEVTQKQWREVMGSDPSNNEGDDLPVEGVSWNDVQEFITKLNEREDLVKYRLPSEAEWEYAARAGTSTRYYFGDDESELEDYAWYQENSENITHPVGQKKPNPWGLYDMHGNVYEWMQDEWHFSYDRAPTNGSAWESRDGAFRVIRGGCMINPAEFCRSAFRNYYNQNESYHFFGFRLIQEM